MCFRLLALALAAGAFSCPARADLRCHPSVKAPETYRARYERLPASVRRVDVTLRVFRHVTGGERGGYWHAYPETGPLVGLTKQQQASVFYHELGHHAWVYAGVDQAAWNALWRRLKAEMPSPYARTNAAEGFADSFKYWQMGRKLHPEVRAFLLEQLGD
jgi:hypothetical protein